MAYQNVGTPRFYIDTIQCLKSEGFDFESWYHNYVFTDLNENEYGFSTSTNYMNLSYLTHPEIFAFKPEIQKDLNIDSSGSYRLFAVPVRGSGLTGKHMGRYIAILNHNYGDMGSTAYYEMVQVEGLVDGEWIYNTELHSNTQEDSILNYEPYYMKNGSSIYEVAQFAAYSENFDPLNDDFCVGQIALSEEKKGQLPGLAFGAVSYGIYYDMPHSPEMDITMTIENDGFDAITTQGGAHLTNIRYNGAPMWKRIDGTEAPPWTVGEPNAFGRRRGRRVWSMNFKYLSDKDLFASNYMSNNYTESSTGYDSADLDTDADGNNVFYYNIVNDDSFHAQVLNNIGNGQRFIFQPDNNNFNPDQFAICQLDQNNLNIKQVANGVYDISLKIREVW